MPEHQDAAASPRPVVVTNLDGGAAVIDVGDTRLRLNAEEFALLRLTVNPAPCRQSWVTRVRGFLSARAPQPAHPALDLPDLQREEEPAFARDIVGPLGKLVEVFKTKVDERTYGLFIRHCALNGSNPSGLLRDFIYLCVYRKTYRAMVAEKLIHDDERTEALRELTGHIGAPE